LADYDLVIIGAGPGGYVAAIRAGQLGMRVAVVEREAVGGVCLNWGCIPSKALLRNAEVLELVHKAEDFGISFDNLRYDFGKAIDRSRRVVHRLTGGVRMLLRKNRVDLIEGAGALRGGGTVEIEDTGRTVSADNVIVATGAREREVPGLTVDRRTVISSREALELRRVPARVAIVGGGATGAEFAYIYRTYGAEVTIVELMPRLVPNEDEEISSLLERAFRRQGIRSITSARVDDVAVRDDGVRVSVSNGTDTAAIDCDKVLVAVGVQGNVEGLGLEEAGVETERGFIVIDDRMETTAPGVYAIGDVTGKMALAHVASAQGVTAVESIAGLDPPPLDYGQMPRAIYCKPQVASLGLTEAQAREQGRAVKTGSFPFAASGKALAMDDTDGVVKLVVDAEIGEVLGAHMIGPEVTELLGELALTRVLEATTAELGWLVHPHPTVSEMVKEAALAAEGQSVHM
jgi:dihydrolipoamide dehydrogenase